MVIIISGGYIRELRKKQGISQAELAERAGVSQAHIAKIESEKVDARLSTINRILTVLESGQSKARCKNFMSHQIIPISSSEKVSKAIQIMRRYNIDQIPVMEKNKVVGSIRDTTIIRNLEKNLSEKKIKEVMEEPFPILGSEDGMEVAKALLDFHQAVLVTEKGKIVHAVNEERFNRIKLSGIGCRWRMTFTTLRPRITELKTATIRVK